MICVLACVLALVQSPRTPPSKFERNMALNAVFRDPANADLAHVRDVLNAALSDPEDLLRSSALEIIAGFRRRQLSPVPVADAAQWERFVPLAREFRPRVVEALEDPFARVRRGAVMTLMTIDVFCKGQCKCAGGCSVFDRKQKSLCVLGVLGGAC
jgi:hypothetical protein